MTTTVQKEGNKLNPDSYLELWTFDMSMLQTPGGGYGSVYYFTNTPIGNLTLTWQGHTYQSFPFEVTGIENKGDGSSANRPTLSVGNVSNTLLALILSLGDLVGAKITRCRTFYKFTDTGTEPNSLMHYPLESWYIVKKTMHNKLAAQWELANVLDRPGLKLPRKQILRDYGFPGVSRVRTRA